MHLYIIFYYYFTRKRHHLRNKVIFVIEFSYIQQKWESIALSIAPHENHYNSTLLKAKSILSFPGENPEMKFHTHSFNQCSFECSDVNTNWYVFAIKFNLIITII